MIEEIGARFPYPMIGLLLAVGLYGMMMKRDLVKKVIGLIIFQSAIVIFFISGSVRQGANVPIFFDDGSGQPQVFMNPLPHVLMLTAIVVTVATTGVALAFLAKIHKEFGETDEETLLEQMRR